MGDIHLLPGDVLSGTLVNGSQRFPLRTRTAADRHEDASDFWNAVGGQYKVSFNYVVTLACESGTTVERGPEVRTQTIRTWAGPIDLRGLPPHWGNAKVIHLGPVAREIDPHQALSAVDHSPLTATALCTVLPWLRKTISVPTGTRVRSRV